MADADENRHSTVLSLYIETAGNSRKNLATRFKPASSPETDAVVAIGCIVRTYEQCEAETRRMERKFAFALVPPQVASPDAPCCGRKTNVSSSQVAAAIDAAADEQSVLLSRFTNETQLLSAFRQRFLEADPEVIVGYQCNGALYAVLQARCSRALWHAAFPSLLD